MLISALVQVSMDSALPRDKVVNTLHFNLVGTIFSPSQTQLDTLASDIAGAYTAMPGLSPAQSPVLVTLYDLEDTPPRAPKAFGSRNLTVTPKNHSWPREVALCLSFYADRNLPRQRGRIYLDPSWLTTSTSIGARPTGVMMTAAIDLYNRLKDVGGTDCEWSVYSRADNQHRQIQHGFVDDEWDTVRSRGLKSTTRQTVTAEG